MFSSDEHGQEFYEQMWRQLEEGNIWEGEILNETKDGDNYWIRQTISPITDNDGELDYLIGINTDITRKKKQDSRRELLNSLLRHDLSNEHQKAQGFVEMLQETDLSDQQQKYVDVIQSSVDHSIELLRDVRGLLEGNSGDFEGEETYVEDVVDDVLDSEGPRARRKDIEIETDLDGSYSVLAGPLLKQSLSNLVENAIVHPDEVSTIELEATEAPDNPEVIELTVKDDGEGLRMISAGREDSKERIQTEQA